MLAEGAIPLARARIGRNGRGELTIYATASVAGRRLRRARRIPGDDVELAGEVLRQLNARLALGDLSFFADPEPPAPRERCTVTFADIAKAWLESVKPPELEESTWRTYRTQRDRLTAALGTLALADIGPGVVTGLRQQFQREKLGKPGHERPLSERTITTRLSVLRLVLAYAVRDGLLERLPLDAARAPNTKRRRAAQRGKRVTFAPFTADELVKLVTELRAPRSESEALGFALTEALLLTGLRWAEVAAWIWPDVSVAGRRVHVLRAIPKHGHLALAAIAKAPPTKTGAVWSIPLRAPLGELLARQRQRSYVGRTEGWVFPAAGSGHQLYANWLRRVWQPLLARAKVAARERDAQKALRRTWITSALVCGRLPKELAGEVGHTTARMVLEVYDSFLDPANWPDEAERAKLAILYGWERAGPPGGRGNQVATTGTMGPG